ncbi:STS1 [Candida margitis]|uniref:STS1 n=1 Tax=Candida margitis TaxID=1775924 RepID=UPI0022273562|nr:STS1 [Candida margitis]KAI5968783.1 STS1 [Candida margitis]
MMSAGFQWGVNNNSSSTNNTNNQKHISNNQTQSLSSQSYHHTPRTISQSSLSSQHASKKRKRIDDGEVDAEDKEYRDGEETTLTATATATARPGKSFTLQDKLHNHRKQFNFTSSSSKNNTNSTCKFATSSSSSTSKHKRSKTPRIIGQPLPPTRIIETLDKPELTKLIYSLMDIHPELNKTITKISQPPSISNILAILNTKHDSIINHLPYKCDASSDYSYLRIKPYLIDFLNCLEDYILWILPPNQHDLLTSLWFLHESTNLIHKLPNFTNSEFQYTRNLTYETMINSWIIIFNQDLANDEIYQIFQKQSSTGGGTNKHHHDGNEDDNEDEEDDEDDELIEKLRIHQRYCSKFGQIIEIYQEKLHQYKLAMNEQYNNGLGGDCAGVAGNGGAGAGTGGGVVGNNNGNHHPHHHHHHGGDGSMATNARLNEFVTVDYSQYSLNNPFR